MIDSKIRYSAISVLSLYAYKLTTQLISVYNDTPCTSSFALIKLKLYPIKIYNRTLLR